MIQTGKIGSVVPAAGGTGHIFAPEGLSAEQQWEGPPTQFVLRESQTWDSLGFLM